ncbi:MAG: thymidylate synthase [Candidatus Bathyarchaeia archaeon]|nr:thymidylate synthase [Candidatus Bathyarchaeota archaeon]
MPESYGVLIRARTVSEAWEKCVIECWKNGVEVPTEYGEKCKEILGLLVVVEEPFAEPRVHRGDVFTAIKGSLEKYISEILEGTLDWAVQEGKIHYTYHERLFNYPPKGINQIEYIINKLLETSFSRRAQAITWVPERDMWADSPPCLQRIWCTIRDGKLITHASWRSRDIFRAMHMNMLVMTELQRRISERLNVEVGPYIDFSDSAHIYEKTYPEVEHFINVLEKRRNKLS